MWNPNRFLSADDLYAPLGEMQTLRANPGRLLDEIGRHVKETLSQVSGRLGGPQEQLDDRRRLLGALCNYLLCLWLGGKQWLSARATLAEVRSVLMFCIILRLTGLI